ncbi:MAG TPA: nicotinamide phosphoribosyltransferase domain-containing protein [Coleofasciculaceae cyanobacterium]|jgi:nicotinic acid phosphoribosyltransferase
MYTQPHDRRRSTLYLHPLKPGSAGWIDANLQANTLRFGQAPAASPSHNPPLSLGEKLNGWIAAVRGQVLQTLRAWFVQARSWLDEVGEQLGFGKSRRVPRMLITDAYTTASQNYIHQDAKDFSSYQITFRRELTPWMKQLGLKPEDSRYVFFGLQQLMEKFLKDPVTRAEIDEADRFLKTAKRGGPFKWDRSVWDRVVDECDGIIPIKIEALPDGSVSFPGEPVVQITAKDGFGELAAWFETKLLHVCATSERASLARHWLEYNKDLARRCTDATLSDAEATQRAQRMMVDFSDRSGKTGEECELLGLATLTSFPTTSTVAAAYRAWQESGQKPVSNLAMYSLSHRVVESYAQEKDAYVALFDFTRGDFGSYVADCYNFRKAVSDYLVPLAKQAQAEAKAGGPNTIVCARPDSGDAYDEIRFVLDQAVQNGLYEPVTAADGRKLIKMNHLRVVEADGMKFQSMMDINEKLLNTPVMLNGEKIADGYSPVDCVYYGVGGFLSDSIARSNTSAAMKLAAVGKEHRPVMKSPLGEPGKESIPGEVKVVREGADQPTVRHLDESGENQFITWYDGMDGGPGVLYQEDFSKVQQRVLSDFKKHPRPAKLLSDQIEQIREKVRQQHHGTHPAAGNGPAAENN